MCTAVTYKTKDHYFGRNLDLDFSYNESVTVTPRNYPFKFRKEGEKVNHFAMIGMAFVSEGYPLYYEATNEKGLSIAGLNFPENAVYMPHREGSFNIAPFELIPWILGSCSTVDEAEALLLKTNILNESFSEELPATPLHWLISDRERSLTAEPLSTGLRLYENPVGLLTNNPTFDYHILNLSGYMGLTADEPENTFFGERGGVELKTYSRGMGAVGLPGDWSSASRFVRAAFVKMNSVSGDTEEESVNQFFHILQSVAMPRGCVRPENGGLDLTVYSSCCNTDRGVYYYTTYDDFRIRSVDMQETELDGDELTVYPVGKVL